MFIHSLNKSRAYHGPGTVLGTSVSQNSTDLNALLSGMSHLVLNPENFIVHHPSLCTTIYPVPTPFSIHQVSLVLLPKPPLNVSMSITRNHYILCGQRAFNSCSQSYILSLYHPFSTCKSST